MIKDSTKKNFIYQLCYQIIVLVLPLIVAPYLTRTLKDFNLGVYNYTNSIAYYFVVLAMLGIAKHGQRVIASCNDDENKVRKTFWSLFTIHILTSLVSLGGYLIFILCSKNYQAYYLIQLLYVMSALFDITWLFQGLEKFKIVVIKNMFIKILETILIFVLVKKENDLNIYVWIKSGSILLGNLILLPSAIKLIKPIKFNKDDLKVHIKPLFVLAISVFAITIYTVFDKTLLGLMTTKENVAYYEYSNKIITIPTSISIVLCSIIFPKACACFEKQDYVSLKRHFKITLNYVYFIAIGAFFGLIAISNLFVNLYYGKEFSICGDVIKSLSIVILIIALGEVVRSIYLVPMKKDKTYVLIIMLNALINLVLSLVGIYYFGIYGAVIGTIVAELFGTVAEIVVTRKHLDFKVLLVDSLPYIVSGLLMFLGIYVIRLWFNQTLIHLIVQISVGLIIYLGCLLIYFLLIYKDKKQIRELIKNKIFRN